MFVSGQLGVDPKTGELAGSDVTSQTNMVFANMSAVLKAAGCSMNDVVKTTVLLTDMADYATVNAIYAKRMSFLSSDSRAWGGRPGGGPSFLCDGVMPSVTVI